MSLPLLILFTCLFLVMVGYGLSLAVLPFYVERLALGGQVAAGTVALHVGLLTAAYALSQFALAPAWGRWSDRLGRRPVVLTSLGGFAAFQVLFGLATTLPLLYGARVLSGVFAAGMLPAVAAYISDTLCEEERTRGMAWMNASAALGVMAGPAVSGLLARQDWHVEMGFGHWVLDSFSLPFLAVGGAAAVVSAIAACWLPESLQKPAAVADPHIKEWRSVWARLRGLLALVAASQFGMALFMTAFALYAADVLDYGAQRVGYAFALCGLLTAGTQLGAIATLTRWISEFQQLLVGFAAMGAGLLLLLPARSLAAVLVTVSVFIFGAAIIAPNLLALISIRSGSRAGLALGLQGAATSVGQTAGPLVGGLFFAWHAALPFQATALLMLIVAAWLLSRARAGKSF